MKKWTIAAWLLVLALPLRAQEPYPELGAKLEEYFTALAGESAAVQNAECDFLIESSQDSLVRQYVALKIYDHYLRSHIMGDEAVAVHVADKWFLSGAIAMATDEDLMNARIFADFTRSSLVGAAAPRLRLFAADGQPVDVPSKGRYTALYFYDTGCSNCKLESKRLESLSASGEYDLDIYAINTGTDEAAWKAYRDGFQGVTHLWDPGISSDWQRLYGVLKTPALFLVSPDGTILGRSLDTPALRIIMNRQFSAGKYVYGESSQMERYRQLFSAYGDTLQVSHILDVADYLAARTFGEGDSDAFKQVAGDLLYYLSSRREEVYRDACKPFVEKYLSGLPDVWDSAEDKAQVLSLGELLVELTSRTPAGSLVPDLTVDGTLRRKSCLFRKGSKEGAFPLRKIKGKPGYIVFYTGGCNSCQETLKAVDALVQKSYRCRVLLVDMDELFTDHPDEARLLLDSFDLSGMPFVLELDRKGIVQHRYVQFQ